MPQLSNDDPTIPPPGTRTGQGIQSILPYLAKSLATKPQVPVHPDDISPPSVIDPSVADDNPPLAPR
jgi:hypothetical protein